MKFGEHRKPQDYDLVVCGGRGMVLEYAVFYKDQCWFEQNTNKPVYNYIRLDGLSEEEEALRKRILIKIKAKEGKKIKAKDLVAGQIYMTASPRVMHEYLYLGRGELLSKNNNYTYKGDIFLEIEGLDDIHKFMDTDTLFTRFHENITVRHTEGVKLSETELTEVINKINSQFKEGRDYGSFVLTLEE